MCASCRRFVRTGRCPLVFVVSDSLSGDAGSRLLFPKDVQEELSIHNIRSVSQHPRVELKEEARQTTNLLCASFSHAFSFPPVLTP